MNALTLQKRWQETLEIRCPHCCEIHEISVRQAYIEMTLDAAEDRALPFVASLRKCGLL
jgi:phage FluMu protein Com